MFRISNPGAELYWEMLPLCSSVVMNNNLALNGVGGFDICRTTEGCE